MFDSTNGVEAVPCTTGLTFEDQVIEVSSIINRHWDLIMSSLQYGQISKILSKRKEASQKREEFSQKIEEMGGINSGGSKTMIWLPGKGRPQKKRSDAANYFRHPTSHYKYHQSLDEKCRAKRRFRLR